MKYIYDIILNFNEVFFEFYEWKDSDNVEYIKKIPLIKVSNSVLSDLKNNKVSVELELIKSIYNKCEIYTNLGVEKIEYACLFCSDDSIVALEFNDKGESIYISDLVIDELLDILDYVKKIKSYTFKYKKISKNKNYFVTRKEIGMINFIKRELNSVCKSDNVDILKYIYYECFKTQEDNISKIVSELEKYVVLCPNKLYDLLMLRYSKGLQK